MTKGGIRQHAEQLPISLPPPHGGNPVEICCSYIDSSIETFAKMVSMKKAAIRTRSEVDVAWWGGYLCHNLPKKGNSAAGDWMSNRKVVVEQLARKFEMSVEQVRGAMARDTTRWGRSRDAAASGGELFFWHARALTDESCLVSERRNAGVGARSA